ncbi:MAG: SRPBCC family protein [Planctomycetota bacterium]|jgi:hypothetical protein
MRIVLIVLLVLVLLFAAVFVIGGMMLDKNYSLERSMVIDAPPQAIHALVGDLARWEEWTPWKDADESVKVTLGEKTTGVGASQTWTSKDGDGELTFTKWDPMTGVEYDMAFISEGSKLPSKGSVTYEVIEGGTRVTWAMEGTMDMAVVGGYFATMMDPAVGPMFETGLQNLRDKCEGVSTSPKEDPDATNPEIGKPAEPTKEELEKMKEADPAGAGTGG